LLIAAIADDLIYRPHRGTVLRGGPFCPAATQKGCVFPAHTSLRSRTARNRATVARILNSFNHLALRQMVAVTVTITLGEIAQGSSRGAGPLHE